MVHPMVTWTRWTPTVNFSTTYRPGLSCLKLVHQATVWHLLRHLGHCREAGARVFVEDVRVHPQCLRCQHVPVMVVNQWVTMVMYVDNDYNILELTT